MNQNEVTKDIEALVAKYDAMKKRDKMDLSCDPDLTVAIMNLVGIEEHFFSLEQKLATTSILI